jgi:hypothetical protein
MFSDLNELLDVLKQYQAGTLTAAAAADRLVPLVRRHGGTASPAAVAMLAKVDDPRMRELLAEVERRLGESPSS